MLCIWILQIVLGYSLRDTDYGHHHPNVGETWSMWSWMQFTGFGLLVTGTFVYDKTVRLPWIAYEVDVIQDRSLAEGPAETT
jgi:hypothetical protein